MRDCFSRVESICNESDFQRRFCIPRSVFNTILNILIRIEPFVKHVSKNKTLTINPLCRLVGVMRQLIYGVGANGIDEYCRILETVLNGVLRALTEIVIENSSNKFF